MRHILEIWKDWGIRLAGKYRKLISRRAIHNSGGVGIFVKMSLMSHYSLSTNDDDVMSVQFTGDATHSDFVIGVCFLPPSNSSRGDHTIGFFDHLKSTVHEFQNIGPLWICGDFNVRCGHLTDRIVHDQSDGATIPNRTALDTSTPNPHGKALVDFLNVPTCVCLMVYLGRETRTHQYQLKACR